MASPNNTVTGFYTQSIIGADGTTWSILDGQVTVDGVVDPTTANVTELAYENGLIWQKNADNLWWSKSAPSDQWAPPYGTPDDPIPGQKASDNNTIVTPSSLLPPVAITDASGNMWSIVNGQVALNNIADPTTDRVIELAYVNGSIWQKNTDNLWWSKGKPSDAWNPPFGTPTSPVQGVERSWFGKTGFFTTASDWTPSGVPQAGDTAVITGGPVVVGPTDATGVNFSFQKGATPGTSIPTRVGLNSTGTYHVGTLQASSDAEISLGSAGQQAAILTTAGIHLKNARLTVDEWLGSSSKLIVQGNSSLGHAASLDVHTVGAPSVPLGTIENDGVMSLNNSNLAAGALTGQGVIRATNNSTIQLATASAGETIQLQSAHLAIAGTLMPPTITGNGLNFLASIKDFGASSTITLYNTQATSEVFAKTSLKAGELFLHNGSTLVADLHISGQAHIYAAQQFSSVVLTPYDTGHSLPIA